MNALYCDVDGEVLDPLGGLADLRAGRVRFIGRRRGPHPRGLSSHPALLPLLRLVRRRAPRSGRAEGLRAAEIRDRDALGRARLGGAEAAAFRRPIRRARSCGCAPPRCCRRRCRKAGASTPSTASSPPSGSEGWHARSAAPAGSDPAAAPRAHRCARRSGCGCRALRRRGCMAWADAPETDPDMLGRRPREAALSRRARGHARPPAARARARARAGPSRAGAERSGG